MKFISQKCINANKMQIDNCTKHIIITTTSIFVKRDKVVTSEALAAVGCVCWLKDLRIKNVFSLDLRTDSESLPMTDAGSEFQTDGASGASHRKERFAKSVRANGWMSSGVAVERSVRALTRRLMRWLRYRGTDVCRVLYYVNTDIL